MASPSSLKFTVRRSDAVLVAPAKPTPREFKLLSDIDDQQSLRFLIPVIFFYHNDPSMAGRDPAGIIRDALAEALVFYYPLAGRLREGAGGKLAVECTGEGVVFVEANADISLERLGDELQPPFPCVQDLLCHVPGINVINSPLLLVQVTRLTCGGFIFAVRVNHTMLDASGIGQIMSAVGEIARGSRVPSVLPVWDRHILSARDPPRVTFAHREYEQVPGTIVPPHQMTRRSFFFGSREIAALRSHVPTHLRACTTFELLTACLWRCRTLALRPDPDEHVRLICTVNARDKFRPPIPAGYYGNAFAYPVAIAKAGELWRNPVGYAVELVRGAKKQVSQEYMQSVADLMVTGGRPHHSVAQTYMVSDGRRVGLGAVDFGWGKPVYCGPANPVWASFCIAAKNKRGEDGILVPCSLPGALPMDAFVLEIQRMISAPPKQQVGPTKSAL